MQNSSEKMPTPDSSANQLAKQQDTWTFAVWLRRLLILAIPVVGFAVAVWWGLAGRSHQLRVFGRAAALTLGIGAMILVGAGVLLWKQVLTLVAG